MYVDLQPTIIEAPAETIREKLKKSQGKADHSEILAEMEALVASGGASLINQTRMQSRSGLRTKVEQLRETAIPVELSLSDDGLVEYESDWFSEGTVWETDPVIGADQETSKPEKKDEKKEPEKATNYLSHLTGEYETLPIGSSFEVDPVLGADERTIDLNFSVHYHYAPPTIAGGAAREDDRIDLEGPSSTFHNARLATQITTLPGMTRMVGLWKPEGLPRFDNTDILQAVFIRAEVVSLLGEDESE